MRYVVRTNIVVGTVAEDGLEVLDLVSEPTLPEQGADAVLGYGGVFRLVGALHLAAAGLLCR